MTEGLVSWRRLGRTRSVRERHRPERIIEVRWWSLEEVDAALELVFPVDLVARIREHAGRP